MSDDPRPCKASRESASEPEEEIILGSPTDDEVKKKKKRRGKRKAMKSSDQSEQVDSVSGQRENETKELKERDKYRERGTPQPVDIKEINSDKVTVDVTAEKDDLERKKPGDELGLNWLVQKYVNELAEKAGMDAAILKVMLRALVEEVRIELLNPEKKEEMRLRRKQMKENSRILEQEEIEEMLSRDLTDVELNTLVHKRWDEDRFKRCTKMGKINPASLIRNGSNVIIIHDLNGKKSRFMETMEVLDSVVVERTNSNIIKSGDVYSVKSDCRVLSGAVADTRGPGTAYLVAGDAKNDKIVYELDVALDRIGEDIAHDVSSRKTFFIFPNGPVGSIMRKVLEYNLRRNGQYAEVYLEQEVDVKKEKIYGEPTKTVLVEGRGKSYADLLREVKSNVPVEEVKDVLSLRKMENKEVLQIRIKEGPKANELVAKLKTKLEDVKCRLRGAKSCSFLIRDIELDTTEDELKKNLGEIIGATQEELVVKGMRPAYGGTQVARVTMEAELGKKLKTVTNVKIGWSSCRIVQLESDERCFRCWSTGHEAWDCTGVDRSKCCFRCGLEGHLSYECKGKVRCLDCNKEGHRTGSPQCKKEVSTQ